MDDVSPEPAPEALPDEAYVVRGGLMDTRDMRNSAQTHHLEMLEEGKTDEWALSVWSAPGLDPDEIALASPLRHSSIRVSTVGAIRALGHDVIPCVGSMHADLKLAGKPDDEDLEALRNVFDPPRPNPRLEVTDA